MKKIIALLLSIVCLFSCMATTASAGLFQDVIDNITINMGLEPDEPIIYGIVYDSNSLLSGVAPMYVPSPTFSFTKPGTYVVTDNVPLAVDYEFVCWEDGNGKPYYAGTPIYIDGQKILYAKWAPKTDNHSRPIRVILTAIEALRSTLRAFFGFYAVEYVEDPTANIKEENLFAIAHLISYEYDYNANKRYFKIAVEPVADGVVYESFIKTSRIYLGGRTENVEDYDSEGNIIMRNELVGAETYSAAYNMTGEIYAANGIKYQLLEVTLVDGVRDPKKGEHVTFTIPRGMLRYKDANGNYQTNKTYSFSIITTKVI